MKRFDLPNILINGTLSVCLGMAVGGCFITAFSLEASLLPSLLICLVWAAVCFLLVPLRRGWICLPIGLVLWGWLLWELDVTQEFGTLMQTLFDFYNRGYGTRIPDELTGIVPGNVSVAISVICGIVTILCSLSLEQLRSGALVIGASVMLLMPCFLVTDTVPSNFSLFLLIGIVVILVLTDNMRLRDLHQANRLTAMLLIPVLIANLFLFTLNPREEYDRQPDLSWLQTPPDRFSPTLPSATIPDFTLPDWEISTDVELRAVGPNNPGNALVMEVDTNLTGVLYLRGKSYCGYDGLSWDQEAPAEDTLQLDHPIYHESTISSAPLFIEIHTERTVDHRFVPYYPAGVRTLKNGVFYPDNESRFYRFTVDPLREDWKSLYFQLNGTITLAQMKQRDDRPAEYLLLPQNTLTRAKAFLAGNNVYDYLSVWAAAQQIADIVRDSARYDLNTGFMPSQERDFALWFLESSDTGYCVHFATAATVLLRAAGIPARYVEGYVTRVNSNGHARVTSDQAHAWVEYYVPELGWLVLEPTPAAGWEPPIETQPTTQPTESTTRPTEPTTQPTEPTTEPTTQPTVPTVPSVPTTVPTTDPTVMPSTGPSGTLQHPTATAPPSMPSIPSVTVQPDPEPGWQKTVLRILVVMLAFVALCIGQWWLRRKWIQKWLCSGSTNTQALRCWRFTKRLAKLRRQDAPEALHLLAQKAKFSQYTLTPEELAAFDGYFQRSTEHLRGRAWPLRLIYRLIFAAY